MKVLTALIVLLTAFFIVAMVGAGVSAYQHAKDLRVNGCLEQVRAPTETYRWVGKIRQQEFVVVYECLNGRRVEFQ